MIRLPLFVLVWLVYAAIMIPLTVIGIPLIAILALFPAAMVWDDSRHYKDGRKALCWRWRWLDAIYGNDEDGINGMPCVFDPPIFVVQPRQKWWHLKTQDWSRWRTIFVWSALRNSCANCRFLPFLGMKIAPARVHLAGGLRWTLLWQGWRAGFRWYWNDRRCLWLGWKMKEEDFFSLKDSLPESDSRAPGVGFAFQPYGSV